MFTCMTLFSQMHSHALVFMFGWLHNKPPGDVRCAEYVGMFVCLLGGGERRIVQK